MDSPNKRFVSTLIPLKETVSWTIHNVREILESNAWTAVNIPIEVGLGATQLSKWRISLLANSKMLHATCNLVEPSDGQKVTHHLTLSIRRHGRPSLIKNEEEFLKAKSVVSGGKPSYWKIISLEDLADETSGILSSENKIQLTFTLTVFGSDLSEEEESQHS